MRRCRKCGEYKELAEFVDEGEKEIHKWCKECREQGKEPDEEDWQDMVF